MGLKVLVFGSDKLGLILIRRQLSRGGHDAVCSAAPARCADHLRRVNPEVVVTEETMAGMSGFLIHRAVREILGPEAGVVILSNMKTRAGAISDPGLRFCPRPPDTAELLDMVAKAASAPRGPAPALSTGEARSCR